GPLSNLLLAGLCSGTVQLAEPGTVATVFLSVSAWLNLVLAVFNLLPGLPMDGGRALETLLGAVLGRADLGTRITAWLGRAIAVAVVAYPLGRIMRDGGAGSLSLLTLVWALLIAGMLWQGATRALAGARLQARRRARRARTHRVAADAAGGARSRRRPLRGAGPGPHRSPSGRRRPGLPARSGRRRLGPGPAARRDPRPCRGGPGGGARGGARGA